MFTSLILAGLAALSGFALGWAKSRLQSESNTLVDSIDALLPQTQCAQCGYPGCRPYAEAIAADSAAINQCPPGGDETIQALATLLNRAPEALNTEFGQPQDSELVAHIIEADCIGCTLCIAACPVDAIIGASTWMHTVIADECTGCELCLPPCPVDCIALMVRDERA